MQFLSAIMTLLLVMDPLGNVPVFLACLKDVEERRRCGWWRRRTLCVLDSGVLLVLWADLAGSVAYRPGIVAHRRWGVAVLISLGMIFPGAGAWETMPSGPAAEPFIVPLATPLLAGPSTIATVMIFASRGPTSCGRPGRPWPWLGW